MRHKRIVSIIFLFGFGASIFMGCSFPVKEKTPGQDIDPIQSTAYPPKTFEATPQQSIPGKIVFIEKDKSRDNNRILLLLLNSGELKEITPPKLSMVKDLSWSPDGAKIAFSASTGEARQIYTMKFDGSDLRQLTFAPQGSYAPLWSPDGKFIIFISSSEEILDSDGNEAKQSYIMNSDGTSVRTIIKNNNSISGQFYRSDGYISISEPVTRQMMQTYVVNTNGYVQEKLPMLTTYAPPVWSTDNQYVLLPSFFTDCSGLIIGKSDGSDQECVKISGEKTPPVYFSSASWILEDRRILFSSNMDGDWDIYTINRDGTDLEKMTNLSGDEEGAAWTSSP